MSALSEAYAHGRPSAIADPTSHAAYLAVRMPATYAAVLAVLAQVSADVLDGVRSLLDLGAGPGTATWAALAACPSLVAAAQVDRSRALLDVGARLGAALLQDRRVDFTQRVADVASVRAWPAADLVLSAYALSELPIGVRASLVSAAWRATSHALVLVEPGTPAGFQHILDARTALAAEGARFIAPCPHEGPCPMRTGARTDDWCHFSVRVPRTRRHRQLKGGSLGYEDEKFAYVVATRLPAPGVRPARVLRHPRVEKGRIQLVLCTPDGAERIVVTRKDAAWPAARKSSWGDTWRTAPGEDPP
ncbi:Ketopantoate hydroxymethyltransferase [Luteitalea pratensis]|uniref:Ketopantoate hydroxymethyltransferase n=1 Tax=Luteitalea pratensis TaxID=1855912 RepID=A0A143PJ11_LUTPR|nr:small ribosomal subunit Rsm22 family protein [Luteitalea pratensis]AMY08572.1 Ketopantoate hydroxymethyltransferase [Luteitalea pratensis]